MGEFDNMKLYHILGLNSIKLYYYLLQFISFYSILLGISFLFISGSLFEAKVKKGGKGGAKRN